MLNNNNNNLSLFEIFVGMIQLLDYQQTMNQVDNNEIEEKLEEQNSVYLRTIIKNQKLIIEQNKEILKNIKNK